MYNDIANFYDLYNGDETCRIKLMMSQEIICTTHLGVVGLFLVTSAWYARQDSSDLYEKWHEYNFQNEDIASIAENFRKDTQNIKN